MSLSLDAFLNELNVRELATYFQPIVNLRTARISGYEALLRPSTYNDILVAPGILFEQAESFGCLPDLERASRSLAIRSFADSLGESANKQILHLNVSAPLLEQGELDAERIHDTVVNDGIEPRHVAVEITESSIQATDRLVEFADACRDRGFLITMDGYGTDESHLDRIARIRPDIIKIDRTLVQGVHADQIKRHILQSVVFLGRTLGAVSLAFGLEEYEDLVTCVETGVEFGQGFLLGRPGPTIQRTLERAEKTLPPLMKRVAETCISQLRMGLDAQREAQQNVRKLLETLISASPDRYEKLIRDWIQAGAPADCCFVTTPAGRQETPAITGETKGSALFVPPEPGDDHGTREYVYALTLDNHEDFHETAPHISLITGVECRAFSYRFTGIDARERILCVYIPCTSLRGD